MKIRFYLSICLMLYAIQSTAQPTKDSFTYWVNYYPFINGVQMVEVAFGVKDFRIYQYEQRAMPWHINNPNPTLYLFRDLDGKIMKAYNLCGLSVDDFNLLPPKLIDLKKILHHKTSIYSIIENCSPDFSSPVNQWEIGGRYANANLAKARYGLIDTMGNVIVTPQYQEAWVATKKNIVAAKNKNKYGILDEDGKILQPFIYDELECQSYNGGTFLLKKNHKFSYADSTGKIISKREYDFGESFWSRRARVSLNGKFGYIDSTGTEVVPLIYKTAEPFYYNVAIVGDGNKFGMINNQGELIEPIEYERIVAIYNETEMVTTGYRGYKNNLTVIFNRDGKREKGLK